MQSHEGFINLLPALPGEWKKGSFKGLRARGGHLVSAEWENGRLTGFELTSPNGGETEVRYGDRIFRFSLRANESVRQSLMPD